ncbi:hypothetical protein IQ22_04250 [Pseudomonas duriflava]|uniref:Uncharacterized protein n=1 Tax=Pseudomonas duriflava TaxID=459528 RepID=A0A562PUD3_9PSED|nr:hypothetical protein [Pseudomonas duriflava]TWI48057.1 hypothetical protein IQ22_04250 [Pseudomonas duriflava]
MRLNDLKSARTAWHQAYYNESHSTTAHTETVATLGMVFGGGWTEKKFREIGPDGKQITFSQWVWVDKPMDTRVAKRKSTGVAIEGALRGRIQSAIGTLPAHLRAFGSFMYNPVSYDDTDIAEAASEVVFRLAYMKGERMYAKKMEKARYVAAGVLRRYRQRHQGGQSEGVDQIGTYHSLDKPEFFRSWVLDEYGVKLDPRNWDREWEGFIQACFDVCNDLDKDALSPVARCIGLIKEAA